MVGVVFYCVWVVGVVGEVVVNIVDFCVGWVWCLE